MKVFLILSILLQISMISEATLSVNPNCSFTSTQTSDYRVYSFQGTVSDPDYLEWVQWDFGDSTPPVSGYGISFLQTSHIYLPGSYTAKLTVAFDDDKALEIESVNSVVIAEQHVPLSSYTTICSIIFLMTFGIVRINNMNNTKKKVKIICQNSDT